MLGKHRAPPSGGKLISNQEPDVSEGRNLLHYQMQTSIVFRLIQLERL